MAVQAVEGGVDDLLGCGGLAEVGCEVPARDDPRRELSGKRGGSEEHAFDFTAIEGVCNHAGGLDTTIEVESILGEFDRRCQVGVVATTDESTRSGRPAGRGK